MNDSPLTAEQVDSAQYFRITLSGDKSYIDCGDPEDPLGVAEVFGGDEQAQEAAKLVRRANLLPTVEARLKEAVELLRDGLPWMDGYCKTFPASWGRIENWLNDSRTFLAKGDA